MVRLCGSEAHQLTDAAVRGLKKKILKNSGEG